MSDISITSRLVKINSAHIPKEKLLELLRNDGLLLPTVVNLLVRDEESQWKEGSVMIEWEEVGMRVTCPRCRVNQPTNFSNNPITCNPITCMSCQYSWNG